MQPLLSVIIPTHKRAAILRECLHRLDAQTIHDQLEVIVVSDGHDDDTAALFREQRNGVHFLDIPKSHQGVARNRGVDHATADLVLFIGDDIFLAPDACEKHVKAHANRSTAVLGFTTWDPSLTINATMRWLERSGWQFGYPAIEKFAHATIPPEMQHSCTYTSHISLPTTIAKHIRFREDVSLYGWEDMEWGLRLRDAGLPLYYEPDAKAFHHHAMTLEQSLRRMETIGRSAVTIEKINPALHVVPRGWKRVAYSALSMLPTLRGKHAQAFVRGLAQ